MVAREHRKERTDLLINQVPAGRDNGRANKTTSIEWSERYGIEIDHMHEGMGKHNEAATQMGSTL